MSHISEVSTLSANINYFALMGPRILYTDHKKVRKIRPSVTACVLSILQSGLFKLKSAYAFGQPFIHCKLLRPVI